EPALKLVLRNIRHAMIGIIEIKHFFKTEDAGHFGVVALIAEHVVADAAGRAQTGCITHVVIRCPQEITCVSLLDELADGSRCREWNVIGVRLDSQQRFALVRRPFGRALQENLMRLLFRPRLLGWRQSKGGSGQRCRDNITTIRKMITWLHGWVSLMLG